MVTKEVEAKINEEVLAPFLKGINAEGLYFRGVIFCGVMIADGQPKVLEFNVRFGDPETEAVIPRFRGSLYDVMLKTAQGRLAEASLDWSSDPSVCIVMASGGYPAGPLDKGHEITGIDAAEKSGKLVFHAGTAEKDGKIVNSGGRVLVVTAMAPDMHEAIRQAYEGVSCIRWDGEQHRTDIAARAVMKR